MTCLLTGVAAFALLFLSDALKARGSRGSAPSVFARALPGLLSGAALAALALAVVLGALGGRRLGAPALVRFVAAFLSAPFLALLVISEFAEVRFFAAGGKGRRVVNTGTYALCRHPGFWWLNAALLFIALAFDSFSLLAAVPAWAAADFALIYAEDARFFPAIFGDEYEEYKRVTPFLFPDKASVHRFVSCIKPGGGER